MTVEEFTLWLFTVCNAARVIAYVPQLTQTLRDTSGGEATSATSWLLFLVSHLSVTLYAFINLHDVLMGTVFATNSLFCMAIVGVTIFKRRRFAQRLALDSASAPLRPRLVRTGS